MHRWIRLAAVVAASMSAASWSQPETVPVGPGGRLFSVLDVESLLSRPYASDVPMACVGARLWAAHPDGWAFGNGTNFYLLTQDRVGFDLSLTAADRPLIPHESVFYPSHVAMKAKIDKLDIEGWKWIAPDDVLCVRVRIRNGWDVAVPVHAWLTLPTRALEDAGDTCAWTVDISGTEAAAVLSAPEFKIVKEPEVQTAVFYAEGELPETQQGSAGPDLKPAATGGALLGSGFGGVAGHAAEWIMNVPAQVADYALSFRYARVAPAPADYRITLDGTELTAVQPFSPTGGWGGSEREFGVVSLPVGALTAGEHRVRVESLAAGGNVNFDLLILHPAAEGFPLPPEPRQIRTRVFELGPKAEAVVEVRLAMSTDRPSAEAALARVAGLTDSLSAQVREYGDWVLNNVPVFASENEMLTRLYWHRALSVVRKNLFRLGAGRLTRWGIAEGRWNSTWYPNMISYGAGHQIRETRWLRDPAYVRDIVSTWCENQRDNGIFPSHVPANGPLSGQYTDWITSAAWDAFRVQPEPTLLESWLPALRRNIDGWLAAYDPDNDGLLLVDSHWWTGMEWQPSFFYFNGFDKDRQDQQLERVDLTAYVYGGAKHLAEMLRLTGDNAAADHYAAIAGKIHDAAIAHLWDEPSRYFYSVAPETHAKALVKEIVGVYPFYFGMFDPAKEAHYAEAWRSVLDPAQLWTAWPVASVSKQCPAYSQDITFNGKDVGGCMWNGPTWPHANSIALSAMAETLRTFPRPPLTLRDFHTLLVSYASAQFREQDMQAPWTGEYYNGDTGAWRTAERDYNHSTFMDIIVADLVGLRPRADEILEVRPLFDANTPSFLLDGVRYHGHDFTFAWDRTGAANPGPDGRLGFRIFADGSLIFWNGTRPIPRALFRDMTDNFAAVKMP